MAKQKKCGDKERNKKSSTSRGCADGMYSSTLRDIEGETI